MKRKKEKEKRMTALFVDASESRSSNTPVEDGEDEKSKTTDAD